MTRTFSPGGIPGSDVAAYYRRRAEGGAGLIITEGTWINHPAASNDDAAPRFHGEDPLRGWSHVVSEVHAAGGRALLSDPAWPRKMRSGDLAGIALFSASILATLE